MMSKGDRDRTADRVADESNWNKICGRKEKNEAQLAHEKKVFGSFEVLTPAKQRALQILNEKYALTLGSLDDIPNFKSFLTKD